MSGPSAPPPIKFPSQGPSLLDPTVMFARLREKQKALQASGRRSTILSGGSSSANAPVASLGTPAVTKAY